MANPPTDTGRPDAAEDGLVLWGEIRSVEVRTAGGPVRVTRRRTPEALSGGTIQPAVPVEGVHPAGEIEVLDALTTGSAVVVDMRTEEGWRQGTIPGAVHIPFREVAGRLDELGCTGSEGGWDCAGARRIIAFCNGPACGQTPAGIRAMMREGFPSGKIHYYRGGLQDWVVLGLTTVQGRI